MAKIKREIIFDGYKIVSLSIKPFFTNVPLEKTIDITLEGIYDRTEINTQITRPEMKDVLTLCTKMYILGSIIRFINKAME